MQRTKESFVIQHSSLGAFLALYLMMLFDFLAPLCLICMLILHQKGALIRLKLRPRMTSDGEVPLPIAKTLSIG